MEPRAQWQALHENLRAAHDSSAAGDDEAAQRYIDAALAIDPAFAPAVSLKESLFPAQPTSHPGREPIQPDVEATSPPPAPLVSAEGWARFEQRARGRRIERRLAAARTALAARQYDDAEAALNEVEELNPGQAELPWLREELLAARETRAPGRRWFPVAVAAGVLLLIATQLENRSGAVATASRETSAPNVRTLPSQPTQYDPAPVSTTPSTPPAGAILTAAADSPVAGNAVRDPAVLPSIVEDRVDIAKEAAPVLIAPEIPVAPVATVGRTEVPSNAIRADSTAASAPPASLPMPEVRTLPVAPTATAVERPAPLERRPTSIPTPTDEQQVRQVLQRYRQAYTTLNARSAQEVWPGVDSAALARAFNALESQELTFDDCRVDVTAAEAVAICRGSARFVPKVGGREVRTEARVWDFRLQRTATGWQIATARVSR